MQVHEQDEANRMSEMDSDLVNKLNHIELESILKFCSGLWRELGDLCRTLVQYIPFKFLLMNYYVQFLKIKIFLCCCSVVKSCPTLCDPMD